MEAPSQGVEAHVLFYKSPVKGRWVAHCLDFDIVGTGENPREAFEELLGTLEVQLDFWRDLGDKAAVPKRAPRPLWDAFDRGVPLPPVQAPLGKWAEKYHDRRVARIEIPSSCSAVILEEEEPALA